MRGSVHLSTPKETVTMNILLCVCIFRICGRLFIFYHFFSLYSLQPAVVGAHVNVTSNHLPPKTSFVQQIITVPYLLDSPMPIYHNPVYNFNQLKP